MIRDHSELRTPAAHRISPTSATKSAISDQSASQQLTGDHLVGGSEQLIGDGE
jgi:hypothetical protein